MLNYVAIYDRRVPHHRARCARPGASFAGSPDVGERRAARDPQRRARATTATSGSSSRSSPCPLIWWLLYRSTIGFEIRTVGANPDAARYAGMRPRLLIVLALHAGRPAGGPGRGGRDPRACSGYMPAAYSTNVGFDAITVALLGRAHPFGIVLRRPAARRDARRRAADADRGRRARPDDRRPPGHHPVLPGRRRPGRARASAIRAAAGGVDELTTVTASYGGQTTAP